MYKGRKLIRNALLIELAKKAEMGVPITRLQRDYNLDISRPHLHNLISYYRNSKFKRDTIWQSLFPIWLNNEDDIQVQPQNTKYIGTFPWGVWE